MKKYKLLFDRKYIKDLEKIPKQFRQQITDKVETLAIEPRPEGSIKLHGSLNASLFRIRCGDYRVIYTIKDEFLIVLLIEVGHRKDIYR